MCRPYINRKLKKSGWHFRATSACELDYDFKFVRINVISLEIISNKTGSS